MSARRDRRMFEDQISRTRRQSETTRIVTSRRPHGNLQLAWHSARPSTLPPTPVLPCAPHFRRVAPICGMNIYIDGKFHAERDARISVLDHGLLYGDGVFEGIRAYNSRVFKLKEHIDRLFYSAKSILLTLPLTHDEFMQAVVLTCRRNKIRNS